MHVCATAGQDRHHRRYICLMIGLELYLPDGLTLEEFYEGKSKLVNLEINVSEISRQVGLGTTTIIKRIRQLRDQGIVGRTGSKKKGQWIVNYPQRGEI